MANDDESKEDREIKRAIADLAKSVKEIKKKNWERYKTIYPELYAEEFGIDRSISPQIQKIIDKEQEKIDKIQEENRRLKEDVQELKKENRKKDRYIEKIIKEIDKKNATITKLKETPQNIKKGTN